ncbi:MAG: SGNH/GDSL hydrolase family protein, partial [Deltaproteobacteria bacterium]|nr:SGNH/GDSL hydrolase family protein [Deltaproteobacteria bacterium]
MRRLAIRLVSAVVIAALLLAGIEAASGVGERLAYGARWTQGGPEGLYQQGPDGNPRLVPGAALPGWLYAVRVNSLGFRGEEIAVPKPGGGLRVWCLGGSTTFDIFARDDASAWPARVARLLSAAAPGRPVDVVNAGVPGMVLASSQVDLLARDDLLRPDIVVVHHGPNDLRAASRQGLPPEPPPPEVS